MQEKAQGTQKGSSSVKTAAQQLLHTRHDWLKVDEGEAELALCKHLARVYGVGPKAVVLQTATKQGVTCAINAIMYSKKLYMELSGKQQRLSRSRLSHQHLGTQVVSVHMYL